ncbi:adenine-specific DNA methylase containing a Zn-ribbon [Sinorhizobium americanum]|uniref:Adenine-specific DNA methylase containing a Zn-ribbon n=1 Tax=Sinorhizobium americanum TaxID=194963 RepID=A0A1L3LP49_9HYPH|nr:adenine-specific DNA methylase containing a Zn-ribbon [Sinorhizobium americanum]
MILAKIDIAIGKWKGAFDRPYPRLIEKYKQAVLAAAFRGQEP